MQLLSFLMLFKGKQEEERFSATERFCQSRDDHNFLQGNKAAHISFLLAVLIKKNLNLIWCNIHSVLFIELSFITPLHKN